MRKGILIAICSFLGVSHFAMGSSTLFCSIGELNTYGLSGGGSMSGELQPVGDLYLAMSTSNELHCTLEDLSGNQIPYIVRFAGIGPGLKVATAGLMIRCSGDQPDGFYIQGGFSCDLGIGCQVRYARSQEQSCTVLGLEIGVGAEISIGKMEIINVSNRKVKPVDDSPDEKQD
jgi:hypothetical protein